MVICNATINECRSGKKEEDVVIRVRRSHRNESNEKSKVKKRTQLIKRNVEYYVIEPPKFVRHTAIPLNLELPFDKLDINSQIDLHRLRTHTADGKQRRIK